MDYPSVFDNNKSIPKFLFMYPISNKNLIIGALEGENTGVTEVGFDEAFLNDDIQLKEFPRKIFISNS